MCLTSVRRDGEDIPDSDGPLDHRLPHADVSNITWALTAISPPFFTQVFSSFPSPRFTALNLPCEHMCTGGGDVEEVESFFNKKAEKSSLSLSLPVLRPVRLASNWDDLERRGRKRRKGKVCTYAETKFTMEFFQRSRSFC